MTYARRTDEVMDSPNPGETTFYKAEALPGTADSAPEWRIRRIVVTEDCDSTETWADGDAEFDNVWDDRLTLTYA